ncbi:MAG: MFS transporter [Xanthobacteraceae bacterium]
MATLISFYVISQFLRNSVGVIAPDLAADLALSPADIGWLSSVFFFSFALVQIPLGVALDRFGAKRCLLVGGAVTVVGALTFATATVPGVLVLGRALLGLGVSGALVAALTIYARRFAPQRFATLAGVHVGIGTFGTLLATAPLAFSAATIGWRNSFLLVAGITLLIGALIALVVEDNVASEGPRETLRESLRGIPAVLRARSMGCLLVMNLVLYSSFALIVGLWGGPYLTHVYGYDLEQRGSFLVIPVLTQMLGLVAWGPMDRVMGSHKLPVLLGASGTALALGFLGFVGSLPVPGLIVWFAIFGFMAGFGPVLMAHGKAVLPPHQVGRGLTILNSSSIGGTFLVQMLSGLVIAQFPTTHAGGYALDAYRLVFALQAGFILLTSLVYLWADEPGPVGCKG